VSVSNRQYWDEIFTFTTKNECLWAFYSEYDEFIKT
jgi:hypothetical protein